MPLYNMRTMLGRFRREAMESDFLNNRVWFQIHGYEIKATVAKFADVGVVARRLQSVVDEFPDYELDVDVHDSEITIKPGPLAR